MDNRPVATTPARFGKKLTMALQYGPAVLLLIAVVVIGIGCGNSGSGAGGCPEIRKGDTSAVREGWCDEHTFRVTATESPSGNENDSAKRKSLSYARAVVLARYMIANKFVASRMEGLGRVMDDEARRARDAHFRKFLDDVLDKGSVIRRLWGEDDACEVVVQIRRANLKKSVETEF